MSVADRYFKFCASLHFAIFLILTIGAVVAVGTFLESYHGAEAAQMLVYRTPWFGLFLILLALNLLASALSRLPWKREHTGFLTTHLGIILILVGAFVTQQFGIEGQVAIQEGTSESRMTLQSPYRPILQVVSSASGEIWTYGFRGHPLPWTGSEKLKTDRPAPFEIRLKADYPKALAEEKIVPADEGKPALHVFLQGAMAKTDHWLFLDDPKRGSVMLGPATIRFSSEPISFSSPSRDDWGQLQFRLQDGKTLFLPLNEKMISKKVKLEGAPFQVFVKRVLKDAAVEGAQLMDKSNEWRNPAVEFSLEGREMSERHTAFSNFPDFPSAHGHREGSVFNVKITYEREAEGAQAAGNELRFHMSGDDSLIYQSKKGSEIRDGRVELQKSEATGWRDFQFTVDTFYPHAIVEREFVALPPISEQGDAMPVIHAEIAKGAGKKSFWLMQGEARHIELDGAPLHVIYGLATQPLGFQLQLNDFIIETDPGTEKPASFKSEVTLKDAALGIKRDALIQMNQPLVHRGFKVYQSAYQINPGQPEVSIFSVARDPGNPFKYTGAIVLVTGIAMLFYVRPLSSLKTSDPKMRKR